MSEAQRQTEQYLLPFEDTPDYEVLQAERGSARKGGIRGEDPVVTATVTMRMRWWDQCGQPLDKPQGGEYQLGAAIRLRFGQVVHQPVRVEKVATAKTMSVNKRS